MQRSNPHDLKLAFRRLYNAAPPEYEQVCAEMARYLDDALENVLRADQTKILQFQGMAQQCQAFLSILLQSQTYEPKKPTPPPTPP